MRSSENFQPIRKRDTDIGRFWSAAHRAAAKRERQEKRRRRQLRYLGIAAIATLAFAGTFDTTALAGKYDTYYVDPQCMNLIVDNNAGLSSAEQDWLGNYTGCDEVYDGEGNLIGFGRGRSYCERRAYAGTFEIRYESSADFGRYMAAGNCGILYEDWSWGYERTVPFFLGPLGDSRID